MNNQEQSWKGLPEEQLTDKLAGQIRSQADPEAIRKRKGVFRIKYLYKYSNEKNKKNEESFLCRLQLPCSCYLPSDITF